jgi:hypothetical protein
MAKRFAVTAFGDQRPTTTSGLQSQKWKNLLDPGNPMDSSTGCGRHVVAELRRVAFTGKAKHMGSRPRSNMVMRRPILPN